MSTVADILNTLDRAYPPHLAESWDNVGLLVGSPDDTATKALFTMDVTKETVAEAIDYGAQVLISHHPLLFRPLTTVTTTKPKSALAITALKNGLNIVTAHTNADSAQNGVSDALAETLSLTNTRPMEPKPRPALDKIVTFVPATHLDAVKDALFAAGAGSLGDYDRCSFHTLGTGSFRPSTAATPHIGTAGQQESVEEARLELVFPRSLRNRIVAAHAAAHPYEEPAFDIIAMAEIDDTIGLGRIGTLPTALTARQVAAQLASRIPKTVTGARLGGDPDRIIKTIAVLGGAGDSFLDLARALNADAYITSDLRHHPASDCLDWPNSPVLIDIPHWAAEWLWLPKAETHLNQTLPDIETRVSTICTDPWTLRFA